MPWLFGRNWDAGLTPFPQLVRWALVAAPLALVAAWAVPYSISDAVRIVKILLFAVSGLCALTAFPTAACLFTFWPQYRNRGNVVMMLVGVIPFAVASFVAVLWIALTITGGRIH